MERDSCPWCGSEKIMRDYERSNKPVHEVHCLACGKFIAVPCSYALAVWDYLRRCVERERAEKFSPVFIKENVNDDDGSSGGYWKF